jgi:hypothetical protein
MVTMLMLTLAITTPESPDRHVRATEPKILSLIEILRATSSENC